LDEVGLLHDLGFFWVQGLLGLLGLLVLGLEGLVFRYALEFISEVRVVPITSLQEEILEFVSLLFFCLFWRFFLEFF
jgi:hypothetical protein